MPVPPRIPLLEVPWGIAGCDRAGLPECRRTQTSAYQRRTHSVSPWPTTVVEPVRPSREQVDSHAMQLFVDIELSHEPVPNRTIICKFGIC